MNTLETTRRYANEYEWSAREQSVNTGVCLLPDDCIEQVILNEPGLDLLSKKVKEMMTEDFFRQSTHMSTPIPLSDFTMQTGYEHCRLLQYELDEPIWYNDMPAYFFRKKRHGSLDIFTKILLQL